MKLLLSYLSMSTILELKSNLEIELIEILNSNSKNENYEINLSEVIKVLHTINIFLGIVED